MDSLLRFASENSYTLLGGSAVIGAVYLFNTWRQVKSLPPGPVGLPFVGSSGLFNDGLAAALKKLHEEYGDIVCLSMGGGRYWVVLNGYDVVKEAYVERGSDFMDRSPTPIWQMVGFEDHMFISRFNDQYRENRKFCARALRTAGVTKGNLDHLLETEWEELRNVFDSCLGDAVNPEKHFVRTMTNVICGVIFGRRLPHGDKELDDFGQMVVDFFTAMMVGDEIQSTNWLKNMFNKQTSEKIEKSIFETERITKYLIEIIKEHEATFDEDNLRDFMDCCLKQGEHKKGYRHMAHVCVTFMADAINTTVAMMMFIFLYLIHYPQYQTRMRNEIKQVLEETGDDITLAKRDKIPFTDAFINEVFRIVTPTITSVPNEPLQSTKLRNYTIPKHFQVMVSIFGVHNDPKNYPEPEKFDPERFLHNGKLKHVEAFFPFGIGRRKCMGEQLVKSELFHFTANFVNRYDIGPVSPDNMPDLTPVDASLARSNKPFEMVLKHV